MGPLLLWGGMQLDDLMYPGGNSNIIFFNVRPEALGKIPMLTHKMG